MCGLQRELRERDGTPNVIQMGDNLPTHSYIVFFLSVAVFLHPVKLFDLFPSVRYRSLLQFT